MKHGLKRTSARLLKYQLAFYSQMGDEKFVWDVRIRDKATALYIFAGWRKSRDK